MGRPIIAQGAANAVSQPWGTPQKSSSPERAAETVAIGSVALSGFRFVTIGASQGCARVARFTLGYDRSPRSGLKTNTDKRQTKRE